MRQHWGLSPAIFSLETLPNDCKKNRQLKRVAAGARNSCGEGRRDYRRQTAYRNAARSRASTCRTVGMPDAPTRSMLHAAAALA